MAMTREAEMALLAAGAYWDICCNFEYKKN